MDLHSLAIDQQTEKMYWIMPEKADSSHLYSALLNGKDSKELSIFNHMGQYAQSNTLTVSKSFLIIASWCTTCSSKSIWKDHIPKIKVDVDFTPLFKVTERLLGLAANYKMEEQFLGKSECSEVHNKYEPNKTFKIAKDYEGPFCVNGSKVPGQSLCNCSPGYIGERCDVSVCENYCLQGNCSFTDAGLPECR